MDTYMPGVIWLEKAIAARHKGRQDIACDEIERTYFILVELVQLLRQYPGESRILLLVLSSYSAWWQISAYSSGP